MIGSIFLASLLGVLTMQLTNPTDISGNWTGENWKHVTLASVAEANDWYSGTFIDASGRRGALRLEWSRLQRRYNGRWKVGEAEAGLITLRASENGTLRGALSVDPESQLEPHAPRLLEFAWQPATAEAQPQLELKPVEPQVKRELPGRQVPSPSVSVKSPTQGLVVRVADKIKLGERVERGELIAEIEPTETAATAERQQQLSMLQRKSEAAGAKILAHSENVQAARQICAAIEAQIITLESAKQKNKEAISEGLVTQSTELEVQSNLDSALVALKKAEADVVKAQTEQKLANDERSSTEKEILELMTKLQQVTRLQILAPVAGKVTYIGTFRQSNSVETGDVICAVTPDPAQPSALSESSQAPGDSSASAPATPTNSKASVSELGLSNPMQGVIGFGPPSELAKRLRESQQRLARIATSIEADNAQLKQTQIQVLSLREKQAQTEEDEKKRVWDAQIAMIQSMQGAKENEIEARTAEKKIAQAELAEAEHEQQFILQLLQAKISAAMRQLEFKHSKVEDMQLGVSEGRAPPMALSQAKEALLEAEAELQQLKLLYDFYSNIGKNDAQQKSAEH